MTHDNIASPEAPSIAGGSAMLPLLGSLLFTLVWGAYTIWVSLEILSQHP